MAKLRSTFPFGWIRGYADDNWQILWDLESGEMYLKGSLSGNVVQYTKAGSWEEAKIKSEELSASPGQIKELL